MMSSILCACILCDSFISGWCNLVLLSLLLLLGSCVVKMYS